MFSNFCNNRIYRNYGTRKHLRPALGISFEAVRKTT